jgi:glutaredoxin
MKIEIYSKPNCPQCDKAKAFLKGKNLEYTEIKCATPDQLSMVREKFPTARAFPICVVDDNMVTNYENIGLTKGLSI